VIRAEGHCHLARNERVAGNETLEGRIQEPTFLTMGSCREIVAINVALVELIRLSQGINQKSLYPLKTTTIFFLPLGMERKSYFCGFSSP
jgi:hypothetical protein